MLISFPPLNNMLKLGGLSCLSQIRFLKSFALSSLISFRRDHPPEWVTTSSGRDADLSFLMKESKFSHIKVGNIVDTETHMTRILLPVAGCVRKSNDSHSAIRIAYRSSLRSSSVREPRYPPLKIFFFLFCLGLQPRREARLVE